MRARRIPWGRFVGVPLIVAAVCTASPALAQYSISGYPTDTYGDYFTPDPFNVSPWSGAQPQVIISPLWQTAPFSVGYNLLAGYRPIYGGVRQPIGDEIVWTSRNSYVYRPLYAPQNSSTRLPWGMGQLVIDYPGTQYEKYRTSSGSYDAAAGTGTTAEMFAPELPRPAMAPQVVTRRREF